MSERTIWYGAYGSNMLASRFRCYLQGGRPEGGARTYPGARDGSEPQASAALWLPGGVYFATESIVWGGARALYDPQLPRRAAACGWLITEQQFSDVVAQEMYREPGTDLDLGPLRSGETGTLRLGPGHYETLILAGWRGGIPVITFTAPWQPGTPDAPPLRPPSAAYLTVLGRGLGESHGWDARAAGAYLAGLPGVTGLARGSWRSGQIAALLDGFPECRGRRRAAPPQPLAAARLRNWQGGNLGGYL